MGLRRVFNIALWFGIALAGPPGSAFGQPPAGYRNSYTPGNSHVYSVDIDLNDDFGPAGNNGSVRLYEFGYLSSDVAQEWPVCGPGINTSPRIPVSADGQFTVTSAATTTFPNAVDNLNFKPFYLQSPNYMSPVYAYRIPGGSRCACLSDMITPRAGPQYLEDSARQGVTPLSNMPPRFLASTYEVISNSMASNFSAYGPVAVSNNPVGDPRAFVRFHPPSTGTPPFSVCSCPNINEQATPYSVSPDGRHGSLCSPMVADDPPGVRVLASYATLEEYYKPHILTDWKEHSSTPLPLAKTVLLPRSSSDLTSLDLYNRRIWTCSAPYEPNKGSGNCEYSRTKHACGEGATGITLSPYGADKDTASNAGFQSLANKKLACCLNSHTLRSDGTTHHDFLKYDCTETKLLDAAGKQLDFNALWAGSDDTQDGGQLNALALVSAVGQPITGFYSLRGTRCSKFSEFGGVLQPKRVKPFLSASQQTTVSGTTGIEDLGPAYPLPSSAAYQNLKAGINKGVPSTLQEMNDCPILVRAALVATCPASNPASPPDLRFQEPADSTIKRCPMAASISVHLRIEQLYHIAGQAPLKTFDTRAMKDPVTVLDVSEIIGSRFGETCFPGTRREGGVCMY